jgi:hypothetical protein
LSNKTASIYEEREVEEKLIPLETERGVNIQKLGKVIDRIGETEDILVGHKDFFNASTY